MDCQQVSSPTQTVAIKRAALYIRVSTAEQAEHGYSLQAQEQVLREFCMKHDYHVMGVYADEGISGKRTENRPGYQKLMKDVQLGLFDQLFIWKLTRLGRRMQDVLNTTEMLFKHGVGFHSISENFDVTTSTGRLMLQILGSFGEFERNQISENVQLGMKSLVKDKKRYAGGRRLGYISGIDEKGMKQLIIEPEEANIVKQIFCQYAEGKGYRAIANQLNNQGRLTVKGNSFSTNAVKDILNNQVYGGYLLYAKYQNWEEKRRKGKNPTPILVKGTHEPIVSEELFEQVHRRLLSENKQPNWNHQGENLLTGLLRCPECGGAMAASNTTNTLKDGTKKKIRYYSCATFRNKGASVCHANSIQAKVAEAFVADRLKEIIQVPEIVEQLVKELNKEKVCQVMPLEQELAVNQVEQSSLEEKLTRFRQVLDVTPEMIEDIQPRINTLITQQNELKSRSYEILSILDHQHVKVHVKDVKQLAKALGELLEGREKAKIKAIYRTFIKEITFDIQDKTHLQLTMYFDEGIINQLNEHYREVVSNKMDAALFDYPGSLLLTI